MFKYFRITCDYKVLGIFPKRKVYIVAALNVKQAMTVVLKKHDDRKCKLRSLQIIPKSPQIVIGV